MALKYTAVVDALSGWFLLWPVVVLCKLSNVSCRHEMAVAFEDPVVNELLAQNHVV